MTDQQELFLRRDNNEILVDWKNRKAYPLRYCSGGVVRICRNGIVELADPGYIPGSDGYLLAGNGIVAAVTHPRPRLARRRYELEVTPLET